MALKKTPKKKTAVKKKTATKVAGKKTAAKKGAARKLPVKKKTAARKKKPSAPAASRPIVDNPAAQAQARKIAHLLSDKKAVDVVILDVRGLVSYADYIVVASGESDRQVSSMAEHVLTQLKAEGVRPISHEGMETGQWVLLDFGEVLVHLFFSEMRAYYDVEGLWVDARREKVA
jgi:ribosome-associated protein